MKYDGKDASKMRAKPSGVIYSVAPLYYSTEPADELVGKVLCALNGLFGLE